MGRIALMFGLETGDETAILVTMIVTSTQLQPAPSFLTPGECENQIGKDGLKTRLGQSADSGVMGPRRFK